jgi:hypothetical protein
MEGSPAAPWCALLVGHCGPGVTPDLHASMTLDGKYRVASKAGALRRAPQISEAGLRRVCPSDLRCAESRTAAPAFSARVVAGGVADFVAALDDQRASRPPPASSTTWALRRSLERGLPANHAQARRRARDRTRTRDSAHELCRAADPVCDRVSQLRGRVPGGVGLRGAASGCSSSPSARSTRDGWTPMRCGSPRPGKDCSLDTPPADCCTCGRLGLLVSAGLTAIYRA